MAIVTSADLTERRAPVDANNNFGYRAADEQTHLGQTIDARLFKHPFALSEWQRRSTFRGPRRVTTQTQITGTLQRRSSARGDTDRVRDEKWLRVVVR